MSSSQENSDGRLRNAGTKVSTFGGTDKGELRKSTFGTTGTVSNHNQHLFNTEQTQKEEERQETYQINGGQINREQSTRID